MEHLVYCLSFFSSILVLLRYLKRKKRIWVKLKGIGMIIGSFHAKMG